MKTLRFRTTIQCAGCVTAITPKMAGIEAIEKWHVDINSPDKILTVAVREDFSEERLQSELKEAGYFAEKI